MRLSFITKYLVLIITMAIVSNNTLGIPTNANGRSMITFREKNGMKEGIARGM